MISDGIRLSRVNQVDKIISGLFLKNLRFCIKEKAKIYDQIEARFKVFLTMQITLPKFKEERLSSGDLGLFID